MEPKIIVFSLGHDCPFDAIKKNILSVQKQCCNHNIIHVVVDDGSVIDITDTVSQYSDVKFFRNNQRLGAINLLIINDFIETSNDIVVILDLHNWFADAYAIQTIISYHSFGINVTYGSYISSNARKHRAEYIERIPESTLKTKRHRVSSWEASIPLTFRASLLKHINMDNLKYGEHYICNYYEIPLFHMLLDLTPYNKVKLLDEIIAVKNVDYVVPDNTHGAYVKVLTPLEEIDDGKPVTNHWFVLLPIEITDKDIKKYENMSR